MTAPAHWRALLLGALLALAMPAATAGAGEISACFLAGSKSTCARPVLQHVEFKSVITEFVDPQGTGIGHSLSRLMWREILLSIGNVRGAGVILAHDAGDSMRTALAGRDYRDYLETDYHEAALEIARKMNVQMSIWGVALEHKGHVFAQPSLTILPAEDDPWTRLSMSSRDHFGSDLTTVLPHRRLNFAALDADRTDLFERRYVTRCARDNNCPRGIPLLDKPADDGQTVAWVPVGAVIAAHDMIEKFYLVDRPGGGEAYVNIFYLHLAPSVVHTGPRDAVNVRPAAGASQSLGKRRLAGDYRVLDVANDADGRPWYRLRVDDLDGWVAGFLFTPDYTFTMVHFIEGLYRYARQDFDGAVAAIERFIARSPDESNVTLAAAHQFLAAARLAAASRRPLSALQPALADLDAAVKLTPYDPNAYVLRSLVHLGSTVAPAKGLADLTQAIALDRRSAPARDLLQDVDRIVQNRGLQALQAGGGVDADTARLFNDLQQKIR